MTGALHITNGDSAAVTMRESGIGGYVLPWRDVLHEGPVPAGLSLEELSEVRAKYLANGEDDFVKIRSDFRDRDNKLRHFADYDEVVLWFEWDLYDQLQLIQTLDFFAGYFENDPSEIGTRLSMVSHAGYLGTLEAAAFVSLMSTREPVTAQMLRLGSSAWAAFRESDPTTVYAVELGNTGALPFLGAALRRALEELPSRTNGLSRSESQILDAITNGALTFNDVFTAVSHREERVFCGDSTIAGYIERMSNCNSPLITRQSGEKICAPRTLDGWNAFRGSELMLTETGRAVISGDADWIALGGSDRWLGGVHLDGGSARWRWDAAHSAVREIRMDS